MQLVELKPVVPFCGSYKCSLSEADIIDDQLAEKEGGVIVKEKVPRKRYFGRISTTRAMTPDEHRKWRDGTLPSEFEADETGRFVTVHPNPRTVKVPEDVAANLVTRGLAERVEKKAGKAA